jgi:putative addiction module component (TIGR02574 family)
MRADQVFEAALELPTKDRVRLARRLLDTLVVEDDDDVDVEQAWRKEIERRVREVREGSVELEDTEAVLRELDAELAAGRRRKSAGKQPRRTR